MSQHNALILILGLACFYIILNISAYNYLDFSMILITDIMIWVLFHLTINHYIKKKGGEVFYIEKEYDDN